MHKHKYLCYNNRVLSTYPICFVVLNEMHKYEETMSTLMRNCPRCFLSFHKNM